MTLKWEGPAVRRRLLKAQIAGIDATMSAAILKAKADHGSGAHARRRFETQTGELERSVRIVEPAKPYRSGARGSWGSVGLVYARRIELGFQGKDARGAVVNAPAYPFLFPAADEEYPKLGGRIKRAFRRAA